MRNGKLRQLCWLAGEAKREKRSKSGSSHRLAGQMSCRLSAFAASLGCTGIEVFPSSIAGGDGNIEFFMGARRG